MGLKFNAYSGKFDLADSSGASGAVTSFATNSGTAAPDGAGVITFLGADGIVISGASDTVTVTLSTPVSVSLGGTGATTFTSTALLTGNGTSAIQSSGVTLDGNNDMDNLQNLTFDITPATPLTTEGTLYWDSTDHTLALKNDVSDVTLQIGQESLIRVRNESGSQIANGKLVYISGTETGGESRPLVSLAQANSASTAGVMGIATHSISNNSYGYITNFGLVRDIDTSTFTEGDPIYLSAAVAGDFTSTEPVTPNFSKAIGYVIKSDASTGSVLVSITPDTSVPAGDATELTVLCRKDTAGTITAGQVVYQTGYNTGLEIILVELADSDDATKMPALGIARDTFTNSASGTVIISGLITGQNTASYSVGDQLYVDTTAGALTNVRPTAATTLVQKIGQVIRSNVSNGVINIIGAGRSNDIPNQMSDAYFRVFDDGDSTRLMNFQLSGITAGNTRTITMADQNIDLTPTTGTYQGSDAGLTDIAGLAVTDGNIIVGDGANWVAESGSTARTSLGLGSIATQDANNVSITGGSITGITDLVVADGGTGLSSATAYAVLCGGTTSTAAFQSIASVGTSGQILTSNGAGALPTFEDASTGGTIVTKFTSSDTWTKNASTVAVRIIAWGGGGGGGSGSTNGNGTQRGGGGGGSCQGIMDYYCDESFLGATENVTIGAGGSGGAGVTGAGTPGNNGTAGGVTSIGNLSTYSGSAVSYGSGGSGGTGGAGGGAPIVITESNGIAVPGAGGAGGGTTVGSDGADTPSTAGLGSALGGGGGGGGGGLDTDNVQKSGGRGGNKNTWAAAPSTVLAGGTANGGAGNNASSVTSGALMLTGTGGGGGESNGAATPTNAGGAGGIPGGGGGGSGSTQTIRTSKDGGAGARGELWVIEYLG